MISRIVATAALSATLISSFPAQAAPAVPVRIRIIQGSRQGAASFDPKLADLKGQLARLSYTRWEEVGEQTQEMSPGRPTEVRLPDGTPLTVILEKAQGANVTFAVKVPAQKTHSRVTISKEQRIVHQVTEEKDGSAYFVSIHPWP